ncbi:MAG: metalloregulator ArsR/SmtB family transcription factor [Candidatus Marsarchaeota archaeon]|nr:metalloregulator ArsR/SmtB family transcription factor [Candidatus Marsarchaeota archaeon]
MTAEQREFGAQMFSALANVSRLHVLEYLARGSASVKEIAEAVGLKQSMTSQHLSALYRAGVVVYKAEGNRRIYSLRGPRIAQILTLVEEFYEAHLISLRETISRHQ